MAHTKYNLTVAALEACTRSVIQPSHINMLPVEYHHFPQIFLPPQGEAKRDEVDDYIQVLNCVIMEDGLHVVATLRDFEHYRTLDNSKESDVPEDYSDEESMNDEDE